jgi:diguanylate cyclase (GGDEF)-like protein
MHAAADTHPIALFAAQSSTRRRWFTAIAALFIAHLILAYLIPGQGWISCVGIGGSFGLAALLSIGKVRRTHGILRAKWAMFAVAFAFRVARDVVILYGAYVLRIEPDRAWVHSALLLLAGVPLLFILSSTDSDEEPSAFAWFDGAQLLLIAAMAVFDLFVQTSFRAGPAWLFVSLDSYALLRNCELILLMVLAAARMYAAAEVEMQFLYGTVLALLIPMPVLNWINDWFVSHGAQAGSPIFALGDIPALLFVFLWTSGIRLPASPSMTPRRLWVSSMIRLTGPVFFALAVLLLSFQAIAAPGHAGVWVSCAGLGIYGVRSAFLQLRHQHTQSSLIVAQTELLAISRKDPLTEIYNRRWFDEAHRAEWARSQRSGMPISLLIVDIDHFKQFNDNAGHKAGDRCLMAVAATLRGMLQREGDSVSRYGGEEFAVILPFTDARGAGIVAERLREAILALQYPHPVASRQIVTVSIGVATVHPKGQSAFSDELFLKADAALYQAKQHGRNRVEQA